MKSCRRLIPENEYNMSTISEQNSMYVRRDCLNSPVPWRTNENLKKKNIGTNHIHDDMIEEGFFNLYD